MAQQEGTANLIDGGWTILDAGIYLLVLVLLLTS